MPRRKSSPLEDLLELMALVPWPIGVGAAAVVFLLGWFLPQLTQTKDAFWGVIIPVAHVVLPIIAVGMLIFVGLGALKRSPRK